MYENGKVFSELNQTCLELATLDIKLSPLQDGSAIQGEMAFILFNKNKSKAEVFLPKIDNGIILNKTNEGNWLNKDYKLISWKGYVLQKEGKAIFGGE